jgi:CBS domain-containing protein
MRTHLATPISKLMVPDIATVSATDPLSEVDALFEQRKCSSAPVMEGGRMIGVISRTDLLRAGRRDAAGHGGALAPFASKKAGDIATRPAITAAPSDSVSRVAATMVERRIHRVFVEDEHGPRGVFSTLDLLHAISRARVATPLTEVMSKPAFTVPLAASIAHATDRLAAAHISGVVVVDEEGWPVGIFSQREALLSHALSADTVVEEVMNHALVCLHGKAPLHRAATLAAAARARRVLVIEDRHVVGVITPLDFARAVSAP